MQKSNVLTIAIPTYNRENFLREALGSLDAQTCRDFTIILFDNASDYAIDDFKAEFPQLDITIEKNESNMGNQNNFRKMIGYHYSTPFVMMFHDDDTIHPEYLKNAVAALSQDETIQWIGSRLTFVIDGDKPMNEFRKYELLQNTALVKILSKQQIARYLLQGFPLAFSSVIYRTEVLANARAETKRFGKWFDRPLLLEAIVEKKAGIFEFPFLNYRIHKGQDSSAPLESIPTELIELHVYYKNLLRNSHSDRAILSSCAINTSGNFSSSYHQFKNILSKFAEVGVYSPSALNLKCIYYYGKHLLRFAVDSVFLAKGR